MSIEILPETFKATGTYQTTGKYASTYETGTVQVVYGRETLEVPASRSDSGAITASGFVGRYHTSSKPWRVHLYTMSGRTCATYGRDDRHSKFQKERGISYEPATFWKDHPNPAFYGR